MTNTVFICNTCASGDGATIDAEFAAAVRDAGVADFEVQEVSCLNMCDEPLTLALRAPGKVAYLFAGVRPGSDLKDVIALLTLYRDAPGGVIEDARPAGRLRFCLKGRVPAI
ncbi:DUF1636 family protein [Shimia sp.]|uniref:DUF1636 family protein n=1 Tax=Shimia sp. TaxID=1954381 RepID=UPI00329A4B40